MNSKERVWAAVRRERPDRPASSLRCTPEAWDSLKKYLGVETNQDVLDALDVDLRWVGPPFIGPEERSAVPLGSEGTDFWGCHSRKVENDFNAYFELDHHPLANARSVQDIARHDWPSVDWWDYRAIPEAIRAVNRKEPRAIIFFAGGSFETPWYMRGMEAFLVDLYENPDIAHAICSRVTEYYLQRTARAIDAARGQIDMIGSGGDIGSQRGMMLNPDVWREKIKPYSGKLISTYKKQGFATFYHSCGSIVPVIDDLIEVGLDVLDPIQVGAAGMKPEELFPAFGNRLSFHGAIDEQKLLPHGTPKQVYEETTRIIGVLGQKGGYIVSPCHQVQGDTPPENIVAIYDAVRDCRW